MTTKNAYFNNYWGAGWPPLREIKPYFFLPPAGQGWFHRSGNDGASLTLEGIDGTDHLPMGKGRVYIRLCLDGNPDHGVILSYVKKGGGHNEGFYSKGDLSRIGEWVRSAHDTPLPVGLFIPFDQAWRAVKEFMDTEGKLPTSIEWVKGSDLPQNSFPDPTVRLPGEPDNGWPPLL
jgi:hypothetical protein